MVTFSNTLNETPDTRPYFIDRKLEQADFLTEVTAGFAKLPKSIPPKFFYDETGSNLFNQISSTPEYYVTRTEVALLKQIGKEISALAGPGRVVIEYGCGLSVKISTLLSALDEPAEYLAIDISREHSLRTAANIANNFPNVRVGAICADFLRGLELPELDGKNKNKRLAFFPGSTIGNQTPEEAGEFLQMVRNVVGVGGNLLIGVDLKKNKIILNAAYNDAQGYTAAFNLNLLHRIKNELNADVDVDAFRHLAFYNEQESRIEMHLVSTQDQAIFLNGRTFQFIQDETLHTENSYKYSLDGFAELASKNGFLVMKSWTDRDNLFSIQYLVAV